MKKKLNFDVTDEQHELIRQAAKAEGMTIKDWILQTVRESYPKFDELAEDDRLHP